MVTDHVERTHSTAFRQTKEHIMRKNVADFFDLIPSDLTGISRAELERLNRYVNEWRAQGVHCHDERP